MATIPSPNPLPNSALISFNYISDPSLGTTSSSSTTSNTVNTQINDAILDNIIKSTDKPFADIGTTITYTIAIKNTGNTSANNVIFKDTIPNGTSIVAGSLTLNSSSISGSPNPPGVNIGTIPAGSTSTVSFKVVVYTIPSPNPISNSANTTFSYIVDPSLGTTSTGSSNSNTTTSKVNNANLSNIIKTTDKTFGNVGTTITYTVGIKNSGNTTANNVMFIDTIPNGTTLVASSLTLNGSPLVGSPNPPGVNIGPIGGGTTSTVSFKVLVYTIPSPNPISNSASTTFNYIVDPTLNTTVNSGSNSNSTITQINNANLSSFTKTVDKNFTTVGSTITYTMVMKNNGNTTANNVMFIDTIPNGTTLVSGSLKLNGSPLAGNPNPPGVNIGSIGAGSTSTVSFIALVYTNPSQNPITNSASATFNYIVDPTLSITANGSSNSNVTATQISNSNVINMFKSVSDNYADMGSTLTFNVAITNTGTTTANNIVFIDTVPSGTSIVAGSLTLNGSTLSGSTNPPGVNIGTIPAGSTSTVSFKVFVYTIPSPNPIINNSSTSFSYIIDPTLGTTTNGSSNSNSTSTQINNATISNITKTCDKYFGDVGTTITYTVAMKNSGNTTAINVMFIDTIPSGTSIVSGSLTLNGSPIAGNPNPPGVNIGSIGGGLSSTVSFKVLVYTIPSPNPISNSANLTYTYIIDPNLGTFGTGGTNSNVTTTQINNANLSNMTKYTDKYFGDIGTTITYTVAITNSGSATAVNLMFVDTIPNGTSIVSGSLTLNGGTIGGNPNPPGANIGSISPGSTSTVSFQVVVNTIPSPNPIINNSCIYFSYIVDPTLGTIVNSGANSNSTATQINNANLNNMIKTTDKTSGNLGTTITYTITMKNTGSTTANHVMFIDTIPDGTTIVANSLTLNSSPLTGSPNPPGVSLGSIGAGKTSTVSFKVMVNTIPSPNSIVNSASTTFNYIVDPTLGTTVNSGANSNSTTTQIVGANLNNITKTVYPYFGDIGYILTYTVVMTNSGNTTANNVMFIDTIPSGTSIVSGSLTLNGSPISGSTNPPGISIGNMAAGATSTVSFQVVVNTVPSPNPIPNSANVTFYYLENPNQTIIIPGSANSNIVNTQINHVSFGNSTSSTNKPFADIGQPITYTIGIKNSGSTTANSVIFIDTIPTGTSLVDGSFTVNGTPLSLIQSSMSTLNPLGFSNISNIPFSVSPNPPGVNIGTIPAGSTSTVSYQIVAYTVPSPNPIVNSANITFYYIIDPSIGTTESSSFNTSPVSTLITNANLVQTVKSVNTTTVVIGDVFCYTVTITNNGSSTANNVIFIDTIPTGTSLVDGSFTVNGISQSGNPNPPGINIGLIGPSATSTITFDVVVNDLLAPNTITNSASASYMYILDPTLGIGITDGSNSNIVTNPFLPLDFTAVGQFDQQVVKPCNKIMYSLTITNTQNTPIQNLIVNIMAQGAEYDNLGVTINGTVFKNINPNKPTSLISLIPEYFPLSNGSSITISYYATVMKSCIWDDIQFTSSVTAYYNIYSRTVTVSQNSNTSTATILAMWQNLNLSEIIEVEHDQPDINNILSSRTWIEVLDYKVIKTPICSSPNAEGSKLTGKKVVVIGVLKSKILYTSDSSQEEVINIYSEKMFSLLVTASKDTTMIQKFNIFLSVEDNEFSLINDRQIFQSIQISGLIK